MALTSFVLFLFIFKIATSNCPQGSLQGIYPSDCYVFNDSPSDYIAAEGSCNDLKGHLVSIPDIFVNSFLAENAYEFLKSIDINGHYWIGLNTVYNSSGWTWTDGTSSNYSNWDKGQPNIVTSACASQSTPAGKWYSEDCNSLKLPYVCKLPSTSSGQSCDSSPQTLSAPTCPPTPTFTLSQNTCPSGWTYYAPSKKCFMVLYKNLTFYDALYQCGQIDFYNGTLASIHSDDENNFVNSLASMHFWPNCTNSWQNDQPSINTWIGLHDPNHTRMFQWTDNSPFDYSNWNAGEPNNLGGDEYCVETYSDNSNYAAVYKWNDRNLAIIHRAAICQISAN